MQNKLYWILTFAIMAFALLYYLYAYKVQKKTYETLQNLEKENLTALKKQDCGCGGTTVKI